MDVCAGVRTHLGGGPQAPRKLQMCLCPDSAPMALGGGWAVSVGVQVLVAAARTLL